MFFVAKITFICFSSNTNKKKILRRVYASPLKSLKRGM